MIRAKFILLATLFTISSFAQEMTLSEAIQIGLENNYSVKIIRNNAEIAENNNNLGNAGFMPRLSVNASQSYTTQNIEQQFITDPAPRVRDGAKSDAFASSASLSWTIFDGLRMFATKGKLQELEQNGVLNVEKTIQTTIDASPDRIAVYNYAHLPEMFKPQRRINEDELPSAEEKLKILQLTIDKLQQAGYVYIGMDHFAKQSDDLTKAQQEGTLHRNFQGYSTHADCDTVAMGITAISSIGDNYSQNVRTIEDYKMHIEQGKIPVFRGIELESDDILRREIINQLMCNNKLDIERLEQRWGIEFKKYFASALPALQTMATDGLIIMDDQHIEITASGRLLARTICMEFDRYLKKDSLKQHFSKVI